ncbi:MshP [Aliivibrio fischeri MJ11]|uniref:MshP n=1 Tax=Aliivibrio fischeri (strain MJ11) TaxID=388396 RepID=B5ESI9_ALIFM|nr:hypothetical protein [Aliivibrio fischeri]ACH63898.1 MshP [Aliivibrio fischeri MJ11]
MTSLSPIRLNKSQRGSALILTIFVLIVVGFIALMATKNQQKMSTHVVTSIMGTRTNMAAQSGSQIEISRFYMEKSGSCFVAGNTPSVYTFSGDGLSQCEAQVKCKPIGTLDSGRQVFSLTSTATCKFGTTTLQRIIEVGIRSDD